MISELSESLYKPDILDCISNLSSDEVFTPPKIANQVLDLLPEEIWKNPEIKILDPSAKSGVFLREAARRLMSGLKEVFPDEDARRAHIFKNMLYGIAITELTGMVSRRSLYYSKDASSEYSILKFDGPDGNIHYNRGVHEYSDRKCNHCGVKEGVLDRGEQLENYAYPFIHKPPKEIVDMKFDVIIGNPPYQLGDGGGGGGSSAMPIYQHFIYQAKQLNPRYISMIIPARWYAGGKGLDDFRNSMIQDRNIRNLVDFPEASECFSSVEIRGGVCYFLRDSEYSGDCEVKTIIDGEEFSVEKRDLREAGDVLIRDNKALPIFRKVKEKSEETMDTIVSSRKPFGLDGKFKGTKNKKEGYIKLYKRERDGIAYIKAEDVKANHHLINKWKVVVSKAGDGRCKPPMQVTGKPFVIEPESVCNETFLVTGHFSSKYEAKNLEGYMKTKFFRFLVSMKTTSQNLTKTNFAFVPILDMSRAWTDNDLYKKYGLSTDEIDHIERSIKEVI